MREIVHIQAGQCGNQIGAKVRKQNIKNMFALYWEKKKNCEFNFKICYSSSIL